MELRNYLISIKSMSEERADFISTFFKKKEFTKGTFLLEEGKISKTSYFLESGIIRCFIIDLEGNEITTRFYSSPDFVNNYLSFFEQSPSEEYYELLTEGVLYGIDYKNVQYCFHNIPEFREWGRMMLTLNYAYINKRLISYHKETAQQRYLNLMEKHPEIIRNVPLNMIASYLGITKFSLSRIRKEIHLLP